MAVTIAYQGVANMVVVSDPANVEGGTSTAAQGTINVQVPSAAGTYGFITVESVPEATLAALAAGNCTVVISQGAGTLTTTTTA